MKPADVLKPIVLPKLVTRIENVDGRVVKTVDVDGNITGEKPLALAVASILAKHNLEVEYEDIKAKREQRVRDLKRRAKGLPDECDDCGRALGMCPTTVAKRDQKGHPWRCQECSRRARRKIERRPCSGCGSEVSNGALENAAKEGRLPRCRLCAYEARRTHPSRVETDCRICGTEVPYSSGKQARRKGERPRCRKCADRARLESNERCPKGHEKRTAGGVKRCLVCHRECERERARRAKASA